MPISDQLFECLACEETFTSQAAISAGVSEQFITQYCSLKCEQTFEQYLETERIRATSIGLPTAEQKTQNEAEIRKVLGTFNLRVKGNGQ